MQDLKNISSILTKDGGILEKVGLFFCTCILAGGFLMGVSALVVNVVPGVSNAIFSLGVLTSTLCGEVLVVDLALYVPLLLLALSNKKK